VKITAELSLYPLKDNYEEHIIAFIKSLKSAPDVEILTHSMSTFVKGQSKDVFNAIDTAMESIPDLDTVSLVLKIVNRDLPVEKGFLNFD